MPPNSPVKISHKKDGCQRRTHRFHVSWPPNPAAGSDTAVIVTMTGGNFDLFDRHCDGQDGLHTHFAR